MTVNQLTSMLKECGTIAAQTGMLYYNIEKKRVTHTVNLLRRIAQSVCEMQSKSQSQYEFTRNLEHILHAAQIGPTEYIVDPQDEGSNHVFIHGTFDVEKLRRHLAVGITDKTVIGEVVQS